MLLIFLLTTLLTLYIPGFFLVSKVKKTLEDQEVLTLSFTLGCVLFVFGAMILGFIHFRGLMLPILLILDLFILAKYKLETFKSFKILVKDKLLVLLVIACILIQGFINFPSGYPYKDGLYFWSAQGHDGLWHVALMEEIKKEFPPNNPAFSGVSLYNYHYFVDILMGETVRIFPFFNSLDLYFRFFPIIFSFLITLSVFSFVYRWKQIRAIAYWSIFFTTLSGSFGWIVNFLRGRGPFGGETVFWASQINTIIGNPPHAIAISFLLSFLLALYFYLEGGGKMWFLICFLLAFLLSGFKVSAGIILLMGLGAASLFGLIKRNFKLTILTGAIGISNLLTIKFLTSGATSFLIFYPWWFVRTLIVSGDRLNWMDLEQRREYYLSLHSLRGYLRVIEYETIAFLLFLFGNLGMRFLGFFTLIKDVLVAGKKTIDIVIIFSLLSGFLIPMLFVQKGVAYNDIQFLQYFILFFGFYSAIWVYSLLRKLPRGKIRFLVSLIIVILSVPTVIGNLVEFYGPKTAPNAKITYAEIEALNFLKNSTPENSVILTLPFRDNAPSKFKPNPIPIYSWYETAYVSALSGRATYFSDEEQISIMGYPKDERLNKVKHFFSKNDSGFDKNFLAIAGIKYIYIPKIAYTERLNEQGSELSPEEAGVQLEDAKKNLKKVFENEEINIYEVE